MPKPLHILLVPDKFKGTLSAQAAADAMARGWRRVRPGDDLELLPMSDGGDGFGEIIGSSIGARRCRAKIVNAAHEPCVAPWWYAADTGIAVIESARAIGLAMLPPGKFHPFQLDTFGLGLLLAKAFRRDVSHCIVGIGGSATNDGGFGLARALGWRFLNRRGSLIKGWTDLPMLHSVEPPREKACQCSVTVAVDVENPLLGARGATRIYGPQKGLRPPDLPVAERCLRRLAQVVERELGRDFARLPGAGAAGGLGFALAAFLDANFESGFDIFTQSTNLEKRIQSADLVLTGEGAIDASTLMGKGVGQVARLCQTKKVRCVGLTGTVQTSGKEGRLFNRVFALTELTSLTQAKSKPALWLERLARRVAMDLPLY